MVKFVVNLTTVQFPDFEVTFLCPDWGGEVSLHDGGAMGYTLTLRIRGGEGGFYTAGELRISKGKAKGSSHVIKNTSIRALRSRKYLIICDKMS